VIIMGLADMGMSLILLCLLMISVMINMGYMSVEKKCPTIKAMRTALKKGKQLAWIHDPEGSATAVCIDLVEGSNELDFSNLKQDYGVKFKPRDMNQAEFIDRKLASFHYMGTYHNNVTVQGVAALSQIRRILINRGIIPTPEKLTTIMHRDLDESSEEIRATMVPGSESRISDDELVQLARVQHELKSTKSSSVGPFVFADANDFLHSVGMSASVSLREWKSYIIAVARGEVPKKGFSLNSKEIGMLLVFAAIAYVIAKAGTINSIASGVSLT